MRQSIRQRIEDTLYRMETALGAIFFLAMFFAVTLQVFFRYVLHDPLVWPFEFSIYSYVFIIYLGGAMAARKRTHVAFDLITERMPARAQAALNALVHIFLIVVFALLIKPSIGYMDFVSGVRSSALGIPWSWVMAIFPLGMGLIILHLLLRTADDLRCVILGSGQDNSGEGGGPP